MVPQLEENFLHLERSREGLNKDGTTDGASRKTDVGLGEVEDIVPETSLAVVLHFGEIEVRTESTSDLLFCVMEEEQAEIEDRAGDGDIVDGYARFVKVPPTRTSMRV